MDIKVLQNIVTTRIKAEEGNPTGISFLYLINNLITEYDKLYQENQILRKSLYEKRRQMLNLPSFTV